jgi:hypothetical protein
MKRKSTADCFSDISEKRHKLSFDEMFGSRRDNPLIDALIPELVHIVYEYARIPFGTLLMSIDQGAADGKFDPCGMTFAVDAMGIPTELFVADECNHRIVVLSVDDGTFIRSFGGYGKRDGEFVHPYTGRFLRWPTPVPKMAHHRFCWNPRNIL